MNKKFKVILICLFFIFIAGIGVFFYLKNTSTPPKETNYEANRTSNKNEQTNKNNETAQANPTPTEEQIATFSTKIYSNDNSRQNNINITCQSLDGTIVKAGETFSFCNTIGPSTTGKGYQKADIFDKNGNKKKGLGGGNCQISSTLYNAILNIPSLVVIERHAHSNHVPYIEKGKDAAVAYGSYDLKFRNDTGNDIKILASSNGKNVTTSIIKIQQ